MTDSTLKKIYPFLDGFRAIAIIWVLMRHIDDHFRLESCLMWFYPYFNQFARSGVLGVDVFFVLSGFLITGLFLNDFKSNIRIRRFYGRRFFKIIPQYLLLVFVSIIIVYISNPKDLNTLHVLSNLFFFQNYVGTVFLLGHTWSIAIEEHFYFAYPILLQGVFFIKKTERERKRMLSFVLIVLILIFFSLRFCFFKSGNTHILLMTHFRADALLFGCLLRIYEPSLIHSQKRMLVSVTSFFGGAMLFLYAIVNFSFYSWHVYTAAYLATGLLIISSLNKNPLLLKFTEHRLMRYIGKLSYSIYLWHYLVLFLFLRMFPLIPEGPLAVMSVLSIILVSIVFTEIVEKFFLDIRQRVIP